MFLYGIFTSCFFCSLKYKSENEATVCLNSTSKVRSWLMLKLNKRNCMIISNCSLFMKTSVPYLCKETVCRICQQ